MPSYSQNEINTMLIQRLALPSRLISLADAGDASALKSAAEGFHIFGKRAQIEIRPVFDLRYFALIYPMSLGICTA